ncbi:MAG: hypothetical protein ABIR84_13810 [Candidatus Nitrotoga sp.]
MALILPMSVYAASEEDLRNIRGQIKELKDNYEQRITQLEQRLKEAESRQAESAIVQAQVPVQQPSRPAVSSVNTYNPAISMIMSGTYGNLKQDPSIPITGFAMAPNDHGYSNGFSLQETEISLVANIDPRFRGEAKLALSPDDGVEVENAFVQTTTLGNGFNLMFGRFFSHLGYLNEVHAHAWDFVDQPLVYRTFWNNQLSEDGMQFRWLAPTDTFIELGFEVGRGLSYPGTSRQKNGLGSSVLFAHVGSDIGDSHSFLAGVSLHQTRRENAQSDAVPDLLGTEGGVSNLFNGNSRTAGVDFVWKYAPQGNIRLTNFKLQGEYFQRRDNGTLSYNLNSPDSYSVTQSGWYLQSVYQFKPRWRAGLRYDQLNSGTAQVGFLNAPNIINNYDFTPTRTTIMLDYSPSEFSRMRMQLAQDNSRQGLNDTQFFVQYIMSLGAHGVHKF